MPFDSSYMISFLVRDVIYTSCYDFSVHLSVTDVHWRIIANFGFKFRYHLLRIVVGVHAGRREGRDHHRVEWRDHLALCWLLLGLLVLFVFHCNYVCILHHLWDITYFRKFKNITWPRLCPFKRQFVIPVLNHHLANQCTKFDSSVFSHSWYMDSAPKF